MSATMRVLLGLIGVVLASGLAMESPLAQSRTRIWDIALGTPVGALPVEEFVDPACGTNGGPPSLPLESFEDFARCPVEEKTGLREVWFIYDDEWEYIARAQRNDFLIQRFSKNTYYSQPIITSLFIDDGGLVQGYLIVSDPRAPDSVRIEAHTLSAVFRGMFSDAPWACTDLPRDEGEQPILSLFIKQSCEMASDERLVKLETRHLHKAGQDLRLNPRFIDQAQGDFESSTRLEVYSTRSVRGAPCCPAPARP